MNEETSTNYLQIVSTLSYDTHMLIAYTTGEIKEINMFGEMIPMNNLHIATISYN